MIHCLLVLLVLAPTRIQSQCQATRFSSVLSLIIDQLMALNRQGHMSLRPISEQYALDIKGLCEQCALDIKGLSYEGDYRIHTGQPMRRFAVFTTICGYLR